MALKGRRFVARALSSARTQRWDGMLCDGMRYFLQALSSEPPSILCCFPYLVPALILLRSNFTHTNYSLASPFRKQYLHGAVLRSTYLAVSPSWAARTTSFNHPDPRHDDRQHCPSEKVRACRRSWGRRCSTTTSCAPRTPSSTARSRRSMVDAVAGIFSGMVKMCVGRHRGDGRRSVDDVPPGS